MNATDQATIADTRVPAGQTIDIVLKPVAHPELGDIRIDEELFAIGRTESPFASYAPDLVADLSRRHARIFCEYGNVYIADLGSKNGTSVNGADIRQKTAMLHDGDEICFGGALSYRIQLRMRAQAPNRAERLLSLTLTPEHGELGILPIFITQFPFLISKADEAFSRYKSEYPHQVNYISRRHAHIFLKGGAPYVEDLGSTNGTFVEGKRLDEHAVALKDGDVVAFGGHHFVYRVSLQKDEQELDPTVTKLAQTLRGTVPGSAASAAAAPVHADKTTFVASADSFLDIFCVDQAQQEDEKNDEAAQQPGDAGKEADRGKARSRFAVFASELAGAFAGSERAGMKRMFRYGASLLALLAVVGLLFYLQGASERDVKNLLASGDYAQAAAAADRQLQRDPDNEAFRTLGTEAQLKARVPGWLAMLKARDFGRANAILGDLQRASRHNADLQPLVSELEWMGSVEQFIATRGGTDAPIRIYADEERIRALLKRWDEGAQGHQSAFATISAHVPAFRDPYAQTLSHLRKLQSDDSVYVAAIERLKASIEAELNRDSPQEIETILKEYAEKYPRINLDGVRRDLRQYIEIQNQLNARRLGALVALLDKAQFSTPPFQAKFRALSASGSFPPTEVVQQYQGVSRAWRAGDVQQTLDGLQKMSAGPWADAAAREAERKKSIAERFTALQKTRGDKGYDERLLAFYGDLDAAEDAYFIRAIDADMGQYRDKALARAQDLLGQAQARWRQYRDNGTIEGAQRLESSVSNRFRTQARLLSEAQENARQGMRIYTQLKLERPAQWNALHDEIAAEAEQQRQALLDLRNVLEPGLLKQKLALLGGEGDGER